MQGRALLSCWHRWPWSRFLSSLRDRWHCLELVGDVLIQEGDLWAWACEVEAEVVVAWSLRVLVVGVGVLV